MECQRVDVVNELRVLDGKCEGGLLVVVGAEDTRKAIVQHERVLGSADKCDGMIFSPGIRARKEMKYVSCSRKSGAMLLSIGKQWWSLSSGHRLNRLVLTSATCSSLGRPGGSYL